MARSPLAPAIALTDLLFGLNIVVSLMTSCPRTQVERKLGEILQSVAQSKNFRNFFDSARSEASKKRTKRGRVKTPNSFHTGCFAGMTN
jgi:hypothetical protein